MSSGSPGSDIRMSEPGDPPLPNGVGAGPGQPSHQSSNRLCGPGHTEPPLSIRGGEIPGRDGETVAAKRQLTRCGRVHNCEQLGHTWTLLVLLAPASRSNPPVPTHRFPQG